METMGRWSDSVFRTSARFELKRFDELSEAQREPLRDLERDEDFYGLLVPRSSAVANIKSIGNEMAALLCSLNDPARLHANALDDDELIDLVLDGVLEIESDGRFLCGADALPLVCDLPDERDSRDLSTRALQHAEDLESADPQTLTNATDGFSPEPTRCR